MPYVPPRYSPRDDYKTLIPTLGSSGSGSSHNWVTAVIVYWRRVTQSGLLSDEAWRRSRMSQDHAIKAIGQSSQPPTPTNISGVIPPEIADNVFAAALARSVETDATAKVIVGDPIPVDRDATDRCFVRPRYWPRRDWQERLAAIDPNDGTWQASLARYWRMRLDDETEEDAWRDLAMSPAHAKAALIEDADNPDSGLIPWLSDDRETVARRVLSRSVASKIKFEDIYAGLALGPPPA